MLRSVSFSSAESHPVRLEGVLHLVDREGECPAAVVCHPHPLGGGSMSNGLVMAIALALASQGVMALRFNFRGVGGSEGQHDYGRGEQADVSGALDWLLAQPGVDPVRVSLVGYSFGAGVALSVAQNDPRPAAVAAVGLAAWHYDAEFRNAHAWSGLGVEPWDLNPDPLHAFTRPKVFVVGEHDTFAPSALLGRLVDRIPEPKALHIVPGADHFFRGHEHVVGDLVAEALAAL